MNTDGLAFTDHKDIYTGKKLFVNNIKSFRKNTESERERERERERQTDRRVVWRGAT